jgi:hypothetical protein
VLPPDLQFADRDAVAFAEWPKTPVGGGVPSGNIVLLTNEKPPTPASLVRLLLFYWAGRLVTDEAVSARPTVGRA